MPAPVVHLCLAVGSSSSGGGSGLGVADSQDPKLMAAIATEDQLDVLYEERAAARLAREQEHADMWNQVWANSINNFAGGIGDAVGSAIVEQQNLGEALKATMKGVAKQVISSIVEIGIKRAILAATSQAQEKAIMLSGVASAKTLSLAYAPAAAAASLASFGGNSGPAMAGISATHALSTSLAVAGQAHSGMDYVPKDASYNLKKGEMVLDPGTSDQVREGLTGGNTINVTVMANDANSFDGSLHRGADTIWNIIMDRMNEEGVSFA